jgi:hypothetical protein
MRASIKTHNDGTVALNLDTEAARTVFASIVFDAKFHQRFALLAKVAEEGLRREKSVADRCYAEEGMPYANDLRGAR